MLLQQFNTAGYFRVTRFCMVIGLGCMNSTLDDGQWSGREPFCKKNAE